MLRTPKVSPQEAKWLLKEKYRGKEGPGFTADLKRLASGEPLGYVIGSIPFLGAHIDLSEQPLIPRTETEHWVSEVISRIQKQNEHLTILDIFAGSGAIGIALALHIPSAHIIFGEKDPRLVKQIRKNIRLNHLNTKNVRAYTSDVFSRIPHKKFTHIFANPPYVPLKHRFRVQKSVIRWEPQDAVFAQDNGMHWIKKLINEASAYLKESGVLFIEFDPSQKKAIEKCARRAGFKRIHFHKDQYKRWRLAELSEANTAA